MGFPPDASSYIAQGDMMGTWLKFHSAAILTVYYGRNILLQTSYFYFAVLIFCVNCHYSQID